PTVIFASVTDPYAGGFAQTACNHPTWLTGSQALAPFDQTLALMSRIKPGIKTVGYVYNPAETNSVVSTKIIQPLVEKMGMTLEIQTVASTADIGNAAAVAAKKVDAFFIGSDTTVIGGIAALVKVATDNKIPIFSVNAPGDAQSGAVLALGLDYAQAGQ